MPKPGLLKIGTKDIRSEVTRTKQPIYEKVYVQNRNRRSETFYVWHFSCFVCYIMLGVLIIMENLSSSYFLISTASELTINLLEEHFSGVAGELSSCLYWELSCFSSLSPPFASSFYGSAAVSQKLLPSAQTCKGVMHYPTIPTPCKGVIYRFEPNFHHSSHLQCIAA